MDTSLTRQEITEAGKKLEIQVGKNELIQAVLDDIDDDYEFEESLGPGTRLLMILSSVDELKDGNIVSYAADGTKIKSFKASQELIDLENSFRPNKDQEAEEKNEPDFLEDLYEHAVGMTQKIQLARSG